MEKDKGVTGDESATESSTGNDTTADDSQSGDDSTGVEDEETAKRKRIEALLKEEQRLLKSISDARAERRTLPSDSGQTDAGDSSSDGKKGTSGDSTGLAEAARKRAFRVFLNEHPEYQDPSKWQQLEEMFVSRRSAMIWEDVKEDLEDAHVVLNRDSLTTEAAKKAAAITAKKLKQADDADIGGTSSSGGEDKTKVELTADEKKAFEKLRKADPSMTEERYLAAKKKFKE